MNDFLWGVYPYLCALLFLPSDQTVLFFADADDGSPQLFAVHLACRGRVAATPEGSVS